MFGERIEFETLMLTPPLGDFKRELLISRSEGVIVADLKGELDAYYNVLAAL